MNRTPEWWAVQLGKLALTAFAVLGVIVLMALSHPERMPHA